MHVSTILLYSPSQLDVCHVDEAFSHCWLYRVIDGVQEPLVEVFWDGNWHVRGNERFHLPLGQQDILPAETLFSLHGREATILLYLLKKQKQGWRAFRYPEYSDFSLGRSASCAIWIEHPYVSKQHLYFHRENDRLWVEDRNSRNGLYVNGKRTRKHLLAVGDRLHIVGVLLLCFKEMFLIEENSLPYLRAPLSSWQPSKRRGSLRLPHTFLRQPLPPIISPPTCIPIEKCAALAKRQDTPLWLLLGPSLTMGLASLGSTMLLVMQTLYENGSLWQMLPSLLMSCSLLAGTVCFPLLSKRYEKRQMEKEQQLQLQKYEAYLQEKEQLCLAYIHQLQQHKQKEHPLFAEIVRWIEEAHPFLYGRTREDAGFLTIAIGTSMQNVALPLEITPPSYLEKTERSWELLQQLYERSWQTELPYLLDLKQACIGIYGEHALLCLHMILLQCAALHAPQELCIMVLCSPAYLWETPLAWLEHVQGAQQRYIFENEQQLISCLRKTVSQRSHILLALLDVTKQQQEIIAGALSGSKQCTILQAVYKQEQLAACQSVLRASEAGIYVDEQKVPLSLTWPQPARLDAAFHQLSLLRTDCSQLQDTAPFGILDLYRCGNAEQLQISQRWQAALTADSLAVIIGVDEEGQPILLDAHEKAHGPHGLLAGMTGSGKSECLLTYLLSLAINFSYEDVAFVLIDYKGGMMANTLRHLPHTAAIMTNLEAAQMRRLHTALQSELLRRQRLLNAAAIKEGVMDITHYQRLWRQGKVKEPLAHLFIIADEFAELKQQHPEFLEFLQQSARIGRGLGVHLLLSTQKPYGVVDDQIWSNAHFHLCLKVAERADSLDMLKREDAVYLRQAGTFYLQVGQDECFLKGKSAWTQVPYQPRAFYERRKERKLRLLDVAGGELGRYQPPLLAREKEIDVLLRHICLAAGGKSTRPICHPPLSPQLRREQIQDTGQAWLLGMVDDIKNQRQYPWCLSWDTITHVLVIDQEDAFLRLLLIESMRTYTLRPTYLYVIGDEQILHACHGFSSVQEAVLQEDELLCRRLLAYLKRSVQQMLKQGKKDICRILFIADYERFHACCGAWEKEWLYLLQKGSQANLHVLLRSHDTARLSYQLLPYMMGRVLARGLDEADYRTLLPAEEMQRPLAQSGSYLYCQKEQTYLCQCAYHQTMPTVVSTPAKYPMPHPTTKLHLSNLCRYMQVGWDPITLADIALPLCEEQPLIVLYAQGLPEKLREMLQKQASHLTKLGIPTHLWEAAEIAALQAKHACLTPDTQHILLLSIQAYLEYKEDSLFALLDEASLLWVGNRLQEYSYQLPATPSCFPKREEALLWHDDTWRLMRLAKEMTYE